MSPVQWGVAPERGICKLIFVLVSRREHHELAGMLQAAVHTTSTSCGGYPTAGLGFCSSLNS